MNNNSYYESRREFLEMHWVELDEWAPPVSVVFVVTIVFLIAMLNYRIQGMNTNYVTAQGSLTNTIQNMGPIVEKINADHTAIIPEYREEEDDELKVVIMDPAPMTSKMKEVYNLNSDTIGWIKIDGSVIDYPVMQTVGDEQYYLNRDFEGNYSAYGCIIADTDGNVGSGTKAHDYADGTRPSTNLILHGHNMKNGTMFGALDKYRDEEYMKEHRIIKFSSLYEDREYEVCSVFLSKVYKKSDDVFKYYKFFDADSEEEFDDFYGNIKELSLYETGVEASYGDEFLTLSVCAYHVDNGRFVVVAKRIK